MMDLPETGGLNIGALSRLFDDATNSYKHLFFDALLRAFKDSALKATSFALKDLATGMLAAAWHPSRVYRLSLGVRDQVTAILENIDLGTDGPVPHHQLKARFADIAFDGTPLMRFVPYRLIAPFFSD